MVKKAGKKKGKKKSKVSADGAAEVIEDQETLVGGKKKKGKKGKKGKKKGKVSLSDKRREKLENACDNLCNNELFLENFSERMDRWLLHNGPTLVKMFMKFDQDATGQATYDEFKSGLFDLDVPCNALEQHLFCRLLDPKGNGCIEYLDLSLGLSAMREKLLEEEDESDEEGGEEVEEEPDDIEPIGEVLRVQHPPSVPLKRYEYPGHCLCCKMAICEPYKEKEPKYVELLIRLASFEPMRNHPGHFDQLVHTHVPVIGLIQMIQNVTGLNSTKIGVFFDNTSDDPELLDNAKCLDDYKIESGPKHQPPKALLFYDYSVEFVGCPLLSCDHYFTKNS